MRLSLRGLQPARFSSPRTYATEVSSTRLRLRCMPEGTAGEERRSSQGLPLNTDEEHSRDREDVRGSKVKHVEQKHGLAKVNKFRTFGEESEEVGDETDEEGGGCYRSYLRRM